MCSKSKIIEFDRKKLFIIAIDGLDVSGKETFSVNLKNVLEYQLKQLNLLNSNIELVSFPRYNTELGVKIKEYLKKPIEERDHKTLENYFREDRKLFFQEYLQTRYQEDSMNILICDRYAYSMLIYAQLRLANMDDVPYYTLCDEEINNDFINEFECLPIPDLTLIFNRSDDKSKIIHQELLKNKTDKDKNEVEELMEYLSDKINNKVLSLIQDYSKELYLIPIGSNFNNDLIEKGIASTIIGRMVENNLCTIKYPSEVIYYNNETETQIGKLTFNPDVEIEYKVNCKDENLETLSKRVLSTIKMLKLMKQHSVNEKCSVDFIQNREKIPSWDLISKILEEYHEDDIDDKNIKTIIKKYLYIPVKESKLNCHYKILSPYDIIIPARNVKEVMLPVSLKKISILNKKYESCVIDLDVKTSNKCILRTKVSVADSPSSIARDHEGEIKIILINNGADDAKIYAGDELAVMVIKSSSCETLFKPCFED